LRLGVGGAPVGIGGRSFAAVPCPLQDGRADDRPIRRIFRFSERHSTPPFPWRYPNPETACTVIPRASTGLLSTPPHEPSVEWSSGLLRNPAPTPPGSPRPST